MNLAKLFMNGKSQAVRLPKEFRFEGDEVFINKIDEAVVIYPKKSAWKIFQKGLDGFSADFMNERKQPGENDTRIDL